LFSLLISDQKGPPDLTVFSSFNSSRPNPNPRTPLHQWPPSPKFLSWLSLPSSSPSLPLPLRRLRLPVRPPLPPLLLLRSSPLASLPSLLSPSDLLLGSEVSGFRCGD
uniref:Uncharacterized protein n=1 Tax=Cucumis melo TaxID=3656 RepID=A0A9I9CZF7_CUCME